MKHSNKKTNKQQELLRLYSRSKPTQTHVFKIKNAPISKINNNFEQTKPLTLKELLVSLLLTFFLVGIQLLISQFIIRKGMNF